MDGSSMRFLRVVLLCCASSVLVAQTISSPLIVDEHTAEQHQLSHVGPVYPPIAKAAHVRGDVKIQLGIDATGRVVSTNILSGPPMLVGAATDAVRRWTYAPFMQDGHAVAARTVVTVPFNLNLPGDEAEGDKIAEKYFPADQVCREDLAKRDFSKAAIACRQAAEIAETFPQDVRFVERRSAFVTAATADLQDHEYAEALEYARKAVAVMELGHADGSGQCGVYTTLAEAEAVTNDLADGDRDFTKAEEAERGAIASEDSEGVKFAYSRTLKAVLSMHARVLAAMGKNEMAQAKLDEAAKL
jgi:TonB family protein